MKRGGSSFLGQALRENFLLKLSSLIIAIAFYAFIHSAQNAQRTVAVKLVVEKPPESVQRKLMTEIPPSVDVTVLGPLQTLETLNPDELSITLNLQAAQSIPELKLTPDLVTGLPPRVRVDRVSPSRLKIRFEPIVTREVRVQVARTGEPGEGMEVQGKPIVEPSHIQATGIESSLAVLQYARTEPFDVSTLGEGKHKRLLKIHDPPEGITWNQESVEASVEIARKLATREFADMRVEIVGLPGAVARPAKVTVKVTGAPDRIEALREDAIIPLVHAGQVGRETTGHPGSAQLPVVIDIPNIQVTVVPPQVLIKWGGGGP